MSSQIDFIQYKFRSYYILKLLYFFLLHCFYFAIRTQIVGFEIAEMTRFSNYNNSYSLALKNVNLKILGNSLKYVYSEVISL